MAYAALVSLARTLKLVQDQDQIHSLFGGKNKIEALHGSIIYLQNFLEDIPEKLATSVRPLEVRIRDAAYELEDHIERYVTFSNKFLRGSTDSGKCDSLIQMLDAHIQGVKTLIECIDSILEDANKVKDTRTAEAFSMSIYNSSSASGSSRNATGGKENMVGVDDDLIQIKDRVTSSELNLQIIPIIGTGGIGKTTLARNVFEDPLIVQHFDVCSWVTVSQEYHVKEVLQGLLQMEGPMDVHVEMLIERVYKSLKNRRYLIVMDDMWNGEVWDRVRRALPNDYNGSRVIITTRLSDVAAAIDSSSPLHQMQYLNADQSWALLQEKVYGQERCPQELEEVGKLIARNCRGLPLTIVVISGLLKVNKTKDYWDGIAKNINEAIATNNDEFFAILSLSYDNLPHHLKACFLYMGIFPEDYKIPVKNLIKLWVAEGFLKPATSKSLEDVAEEYLQDLIDRSLVFVTKRRANGRIRFCNIHDVLRELSIKMGYEEKFLQHYRYGYTDKYNLPKIPNMQRRLVIHTDRVKFRSDGIHDSPTRSLLCFPYRWIGLLSFISVFSLLRVVDGLKLRASHLPDEILDLVNLRYLAFTIGLLRISWLPNGISKLKNLETLIVNKSNDIVALGLNKFMLSDIWKMPQLRHLILKRGTYMPISDSEELGESFTILHNLQTLQVTNFKITKEVIERLPNLKKLKVQYIWLRPEDWPTYCINNLVYLQELEELTLELEAIHVNPNISGFPQNLKKLTLSGSRIPWEKISIVGALPNLEVLKLKKNSAVGREWEVTEDFSNLKHLEMEDINLEDWIVESNNFPQLERLIIQGCDKLKEVPESIGDIATLQMLTVKRCNSGVEESVRRIQEQQQGFGNDDLKVHINVPMRY